MENPILSRVHENLKKLKFSKINGSLEALLEEASRLA